MEGSSTNINTNVQGASVEVISTARQSSDGTIQRSSFDPSGTLDQTLGYVEMPMELKTTRVRNTWRYATEEFKFKFIDEKYHTYSSLIVKPSHIKVLENTSTRTLKELKDYIINMYFFEENESVRIHNNAVARKRRAKRKAT